MNLNTITQSSADDFLKALPSEFAHALISDIPYGIGMDDWDVLHANTNSALLGTSPAQQRAGAVFKKRGKPLNGWSNADRNIPQEYYKWCRSWGDDALRILKPGASVIIFAGRRLSHRCICAFEDIGFTLKDTLGWVRPRAPYRAQRMSAVFDRRKNRALSEKWRGWRLGNLCPVFEPILWFVKPYAIGTTIVDNVIKHGIGGFNEHGLLRYFSNTNNLFEVNFAPDEKKIHPTQKPLVLMQALIELTTAPNQIVIDPFCGSGTTALAAQNTGRNFMVSDNCSEFVALARERIGSDLFKLASGKILP
ncbi:MAG: Modification methylase HindIII [Verrucomicrobia subdivision 3 bacterium]|nr:Modification methylase HindIII [Limisphaerales bacterium]MCS1417039.1 Modification methylase HindIII [Limisphaerales bacterium]